MGERKNKMVRACPTLRELSDGLEKAFKLINELRTDHNAFVAASTAKLNLVVTRLEEVATDYPTITGKVNDIKTRVEDIATQFATHLAVAAHPDITTVLTGVAVPALAKTALTTSAVTVISTTDNVVSADALEEL
jgi:hypothetical protein